MIEPSDHERLSALSIPGPSGSGAAASKSDGGSPSGSVGSPSPATSLTLEDISRMPSSQELASMPHSKVAALCRNFLRSALSKYSHPSAISTLDLYNFTVGAGMRLSEGQHCPWYKVGPTCGEQGIVIWDWPFACPFPTETKADKGIEGCSIVCLRLLLEGFRDPDHPIRFKKVETSTERQGKFTSITICTII